jgi:hypothetical protein
MANFEQDVLGADILVGDSVLVRCTVTAITPSSPVSPPGVLIPGGAGDRLTLSVDTPGNVGEAQGVTLSVSPIQCRFAGNGYGQQ